MRATTSVWPPGGNVTITRMGLVGHACACTPAAKPPTPQAPATKPMAARTARRIMERILPVRCGACAPAAYCAIAAQPCQWGAILLDCGHGRQAEARMVPFFVQIKCHLGKSYEVANNIADAEIASEIYSTAGDYDLLVKFYVEDSTDIGHFVNEKVQTVPGIQDTRTIITFKAF